MTFDPSHLDVTVRSWVLAHQSRPVVTVFSWISAFGSVTPVAGYAILCGLVLWGRGRGHATAALLLAPTAAVVTYLALKHAVGRVRPSVAGLLEGTSSFPSAHATTSAAVFLTLAFVLWKEGQMSGAAAGLVALSVPLFIGVSRVYLDLHWATDVIGGWCAGLAIALLSVSLYVRTARTSRPLAGRMTNA